MAYANPSFAQDKRASLGELIGGTFAELAAIRGELALYVLGFAAFDVLGSILPATEGFVSVLTFFGYFAAQHWLYERMLAKAGLLDAPGWRILQFIALAILLGFPIILGANIFVVPGIILAAKWIMAPTYLVATGRGVIEAASDSWRASDHNTANIALAFCLMFLLWVLLVAVVGGVTGAIVRFNSGLVEPSEILSGLWIHGLPLLLMGLSMAAYRCLNHEGAQLAKVFA